MNASTRSTAPADRASALGLPASKGACICGFLVFSAISTLSFAAENALPMRVSGVETAVTDLRPGMIAESTRFSPDGKHFAIVLRRGAKQVLVLDGKEHAEYDMIVKGTLTFSADSQRFAYVAVRDESKLAVIDGAEGPAFSGIGGTGVVFSPDSKRTAYVGMRDDKMVVVADGTSSPEYDGVGNDGVVFSPDSQRLAFAAKRGDWWKVVADGKDGSPFRGCSGIAFSPDSRHLAYIGISADGMCVVMDGTEGRKYKSFLRGTVPVFDGPTRFSVFALQDMKILRVDVSIFEPIPLKATSQEEQREPSGDGARSPEIPKQP